MERELIRRAFEQARESIQDARSVRYVSKEYFVQIARQFTYVGLMLRDSGTANFSKWHAAWKRSSDKLDALSNR